MIAKILGQIVLSTALISLFPVDGLELEQRAGIDVLPELSYGVSSYVSGPSMHEVRENHPTKKDQDSFGIVTTARSVIVVDDASGMVLYAKKPDNLRSIGSVTKLMAVLVFLESEPDLSRIVTLDPSKDLVIGGRQYVGFFEEITLEQVLAASIVGSDNSATKALVRFAGLSDENFVSRMNEKARELGMNQTTFTDPTGIDPANMSTARDLVLLLDTVEQFKIVKEYSTKKTITIQHQGGRSVTINNTNKLLDTFVNEGSYRVLGGKTGFLPQARYVLASSVEYDGDLIHVIVLGADTIEDRVQEVKGLSEWAFRVFEWPNN